MDPVVEYTSRITCAKCDGRGQKTVLWAPDPKQKNILRSKQKKCKLCKGLGAIFIKEA